MKKSMDKLDIYNNSAIILNNKTPKKIVSWITILMILFIIFIIFSFIPFNIYKTYIGSIQIKNKDCYFVTKLERNDFPIINRKKLYINGKDYTYEIVSIEGDNLILKINLDSKLRTNNNILIVNILKDRTTLLKIILKKFKKGFEL